MITERTWLAADHPAAWYEALSEAYAAGVWRPAVCGPHPDQGGQPWDEVNLAHVEAWSERKNRLLAVAWCRRITHLVPPAASRTLRAAIDLAERVADGDSQVTPTRVRQTGERVLAMAEGPFPGVGQRRARVYADAVRAIGWLNWRTPDGFGLYEVLENLESAVRRGSKDQAGQLAEMAELGRDSVGNPFRPVALDPSWRTEAVVALAGGIYADRAFDRLPILADALQDAGCTSEEIVAHCRGPGPHARGCWVVDLLLGKG